ncbi:hypothetical protein R1flu_013041 [Riccia fluitans]|uniref:Uncharacterized protein n=1 Tax=Riccia fluitans TaxID=41844 RepID=A0ABD1ZET4_9MARC
MLASLIWRNIFLCKRSISLLAAPASFLLYDLLGLGWAPAAELSQSIPQRLSEPLLQLVVLGSAEQTIGFPFTFCPNVSSNWISLVLLWSSPTAWWGCRISRPGELTFTFGVSSTLSSSSSGGLAS